MKFSYTLLCIFGLQIWHVETRKQSAFVHRTCQLQASQLQNDDVVCFKGHRANDNYCLTELNKQIVEELHEDLFIFWVVEGFHQVATYESPGSSEFVRIRADRANTDHIVLHQLEK